MAIETWIDTLADAFNFVYTGALKVQTYHLYSDPQFPPALSTFPCALSYPTGVTCYVGDGAAYDIWTGKTEIHVTQNADFASLKFVLPFAGLIKAAAAGKVTLGGLVAYFLLRTSGQSIEGPAKLVYGQESPHWGYVAHWVVKEMSTTQLTG